MSNSYRLLLFGARAGLFLTATSLVTGPGLTAGHSQVVRGTPSPSVGVAAAAYDLFACSSGVGEVEKVLVRTAKGGTRTMTLCNGGNDGDPAAKAQALSAGLDAAAAGSKFYAHARMPELLSLRTRRAHAEVDPTLTLDERARRLAELEGAIGALEDEISKTATPY